MICLLHYFFIFIFPICDLFSICLYFDTTNRAEDKTPENQLQGGLLLHSHDNHHWLRGDWSSSYSSPKHRPDCLPAWSPWAIRWGGDQPNHDRWSSSLSVWLCRLISRWRMVDDGLAWLGSLSLGANKYCGADNRSYYLSRDTVIRIHYPIHQGRTYIGAVVLAGWPSSMSAPKTSPAEYRNLSIHPITSHYSHYTGKWSNNKVH